ncbi:MAG: LysR family transcriptional regulator [Rhizobiaceae bacterium]
MDHLTRINMFLTVANCGSFAAAARELGVTSSAVSKQVQNLEHELKVRLFNRTTRQVSLTEEGAVFRARAGRALDDLQEAREEIYELRSNPRGPLKVSLPISLAQKYLTQTLVSFAAEHPDVELNVSLDDRLVDIVSEDFDLVLRIGTLTDSSLIARRLAACPFVICASPAYLETNGLPGSPEQLPDHNVLAYTRNDASHEWRYKSPDGRPGYVGLNGTFKSDSGDVLCAATVAGLGIALLPIFYVAPHLRSGALQRILPGYETWPTREIHAVFPPSQYQSTRLRLFVDHLAAACKTLPWEQDGSL